MRCLSAMVGPRGRQYYRERRALARLAVDRDAPTVCLHDALGDRQPEAGALGLPGEQVVDAVEAVEDLLSLGARYAHAVVAHVDAHAARVRRDGQPDLL